MHHRALGRSAGLILVLQQGLKHHGESRAMTMMLKTTREK